MVDKIRGGLAGEILRVDLSSKRISTEDTEKYASRFIGGRAVNSFILLNETAPGTRWSAPENLLIFGVGCLVGTAAPGACRVSVDTINAFNNGKGSANFGGHFGPELKYAGFDHVVITGKSEAPVYLWISDGNAELRDASFIWGKTTDETEEILQRELGDNRIEVVSIGPAGENLVKGSCIIGDCGGAAGGSGVGCVMGDKKLKALAIRGHGSIKVAHPEGFMDAVKALWLRIRSAPNFIPWHKGIVLAYWSPPGNVKPDMPAIVRNGQDENWPGDKMMRLVSRDTGVPRFYTRMRSGFSCPVGCLPFLEIPEGRYRGTRGFAYWQNSVGYSARMDVDDPAASAKFHLLANQLGLDADDAAVVISWAFECYEKGLLTREDTDGLELEWGNATAMIKMEEKLAYREGIGELLAGGVVEASRKLGKGSEEFAIHMKGQDTFDRYRIMKGWALGLVTSPVAGRHLRGATAPATTCENQPEAVFEHLRIKEIQDMTGVCNIISAFGHKRPITASDYAGLTSSALGIDLTGEEFMLIGRRAYNLEKAFNTIHTDFDRKDDYPPRRYMEEPIKTGPYAGWKCEKEKFDGMLDRFYELNGWDKATSLQTRGCLTELGLEDVARKLGKTGKLID